MDWESVAPIAEDAAKIAPLATAIIAFCALTMAIISVLVQKDLARKKAAIDFFVKAATDKEMIQLQIDTRAAFRALESAASFDAFIQTPEYQRIISTLCILEMMAVGIKTKVFDEEVCYSNWGEYVASNADRSRPVFEHFKNVPGNVTIFVELASLAKKWRERLNQDALVMPGLPPTAIQSAPTPAP